MRNRDKYPKLFKTLAKIVGARKAVKLLDSLVEQYLTCPDHDSARIPSAFIFSDTSQGQKYWTDLWRKVEPWW